MVFFVFPSAKRSFGSEQFQLHGRIAFAIAFGWRGLGALLEQGKEFRFVQDFQIGAVGDEFFGFLLFVGHTARFFGATDQIG